MNSKKLSTVSFEPDDGTGLLGRPTLWDLAKTLEVLEKVAPNYGLLHVSRIQHLSPLQWMTWVYLQENCYFVAGIIQEAFTDVFWGSLEGTEPTWPREKAPTAREAILCHVYGQVTVSGLFKFVIEGRFIDEYHFEFG